MRNLALIAVCLLVLGACSKKQEPAKSDAETGLRSAENEAPEPVAGEPEAPAQPEAPEVPKAGPPTVELLDAGKEPREPLRLQVPLETAETMSLTMAMTMSVKAQGTPMPPTTLPPITMVMSIEGAEKLDDGKVRFRSKLTGIEVGAAAGPTPPGMVEQLEAQMQKLVGLVQTGVIDPRGFATEGAMELPEAAPPQARQMLDGMKSSLEQFAVPLPAEPVGAGAVWRVTQAPAINGIQIQQTIEYTLVSRKGAEIELEAKVGQKALSKFVEVPQAPGMKLEIESWKGVGVGAIAMSLDRIVPKQSSLDVDSAWTMKANGQSITYEMGNKTTVQRK